jgi:hypothetical protein
MVAIQASVNCKVGTNKAELPEGNDCRHSVQATKRQEIEEDGDAFMVAV